MIGCSHTFVRRPRSLGSFSVVTCSQKIVRGTALAVLGNQLGKSADVELRYELRCCCDGSPDAPERTSPDLSFEIVDSIPCADSDARQVSRLLQRQASVASSKSGKEHRKARKALCWPEMAARKIVEKDGKSGPGLNHISNPVYFWSHLHAPSLGTVACSLTSCEPASDMRRPTRTTWTARTGCGECPPVICLIPAQTE